MTGTLTVHEDAGTAQCSCGWGGIPLSDYDSGLPLCPACCGRREETERMYAAESASVHLRVAERTLAHETASLARRERERIVKAHKKAGLGRNDPCSCGSGVKAKKCHLR